MKGNRDKPIYIFSSVDFDDVLDIPFENNIIRVLDEIEPDELVQDPLTIDDFEEGSVLVFDDILKLTNPKTRIMVFCLLESMLEIARHANLTIITTSHILSNYRQTRTIINEATSLTVFPKFAGGLHHIRQYLEKVGMDKIQIKKFLSMSKTSRFVTLYRINPMFVLSSKHAYIFDPFAT
jgi:hypothetical protein